MSGQVSVKARDSTPNFHVNPSTTQVLITITLSHTLEYKASDIIITSSIGYVILHHPLQTTPLLRTSPRRRHVHMPDAPPTRMHVGGASGHETARRPHVASERIAYALGAEKRII